jgi:uncharacterized protein YjbI with pentapeptide repeats
MLPFILIIAGCIHSSNATAEPYGIQKVSSEEVLEKLRNFSNVYYDHAEIDGNLDLDDYYPANRTEGGVYPPITISSPIRITNSIFTDSVNFRNSSFLNEINFKGSSFRRFSDFSGSKFFGTFNCKSCTFENKSDFSDDKFWDDVVFKDAMFQSDTKFENSKFNGTLLFTNSYLEKKADMKNLSINEADFTNVKFNMADFSGSSLKNVDFLNADFAGNTLVLNSSFYDNANFLKSIFHKEPIFYGSRFYGEAKFDGTQYIEGASFKNTTFHEKATFNEATFVKAAKFNDATFEKAAGFNDSQFNGDAVFEGTVFKGKLFLKGAKYDKLRIRWNNIADLVYDDTAYLTLIDNFKKLGFFSDADNSYYTYRIKYRQNLPIYYRPIDWMLMASYGYGTNPGLPVLWSIVTIIICGFIFFCAHGMNKKSNELVNGKETDKQSLNRSQTYQRLSIWEAINFSATAFTSGASAFVPYPSDFVPVGKSKYLITIDRILGWVFFMLFLTALARTIIR